MLYFRIGIVAVVALLGAAMLTVLFAATQARANAAPGPLRARLGNILIAIGGSVMLFSGSLKAAHVPLVVAEMTSLGLAGWKLELVASLELLSGFLFVVPRLRSLGLPVASAYLGAAIACHVRADQYFAVLPTMAIMGCCWLGAALRHPQLLWSLAARDDGRVSATPQGELAVL